MNTKVENTWRQLQGLKPIQSWRCRLGKHPWAGELGKIHNKKIATERVKKGTHNFQGEFNPNKNMPKVICPHCGKEGGRNQMKRYHFDNCKQKE